MQKKFPLLWLSIIKKKKKKVFFFLEKENFIKRKQTN